ncbi:unnamed protein product, partial [Cyprideis torosa]
PLEKRGKIIDAVRKVALTFNKEWARAAVEETGLGRVEDKIQENILAASKTPGLEDLEAAAVSGDRGLTLTEAAPFGVIGSLTPVTNPTGTLIHNTISMIAGGNSIVFNPHPSSLTICTQVIQEFHRAIVACGGPEGVVGMCRKPDMASAKALMAHPGIDFLVATGGSAVVRVVLSSGKKAIGAGAGNPPVLVDETASIRRAAEDIVAGHSINNNIFCIAEKEVIAVDEVAGNLLKFMAESGKAAVLDSDQAMRITSCVVQQDGRINTAFIGKDITYILKAAGLDDLAVNTNLRCVVFEAKRDHPLVWLEQMMPVLPLVRVKDVWEGIDLAVEVEQGNRHTAIMHSHNVIQGKITNIAQLARMTRVVCCQCTLCTELCPRYQLGHNLHPHLIMRSLHQPGDTEAVKHAVEKGRMSVGEFIVDHCVLANIHPEVFPAFNATGIVPKIQALGVLETYSSTSAVVAADRAVKAAAVSLVEVRLASGLAGKAIVVLTGGVGAVKAAVDAGAKSLEDSGLLVSQVVISSPSEEMQKHILIPLVDELAEELVRASKGRNWQFHFDEAREQVVQPIFFGALLVRKGYADACLGGVASSSRDFLTPCLRLIPSSSTAFEMGVFSLPEEKNGLWRENLVMFADVALNISPSAEQLADIAVESCKTMRDIIPPEVLPEIHGALLSYSTKGSGQGPTVSTIRQAEPLILEKLEKLKEQDGSYASISITTELQISVAVSKKAAKVKLKDRLGAFQGAGQANVLIVPTLDEGNMLYHLFNTQYPEQIIRGAQLLLLTRLKTGASVDLQDMESKQDHSPQDIADRGREVVSAVLARLVDFYPNRPEMVLLFGSLSTCTELVDQIRLHLGMVDMDVVVYPGTYEMEALRDTALDILKDVQPIHDYRSAKREIRKDPVYDFS